MLGTFSNIIFTSIDRWFVKIYMSNIEFAMYSFAVSIEGLMNVMVSPISTTLYNFFCKNINKLELKNIKEKIIMFASFVVIGAYPAKFVIERYLTNYTDAIHILFYLLVLRFLALL